MHKTVLLHEAVEALCLRPDGWYLDATFGRGGHSRLILEHLGVEGRLFALDRDVQAAEVAQALAAQDARFRFASLPFSQMQSAFPELGAESLDGVLFDFGVSSPQLDQAERGFSFQKAAPLDMRMDTRTGITAAQWLQQVDEATLTKVITEWGGETRSVAMRIARALMRHKDAIRDTTDLANVVAEAVPKKLHRAGYHPATQTFQAIRMAVNDEVREIECGLQSALTLLKRGGVMAAISFHDVEARLVKRFGREREGFDLPPEIPVEQGRVGTQVQLGRVIKPSAEEIQENIRSRSAQLRVIIKN